MKRTTTTAALLVAASGMFLGSVANAEPEAGFVIEAVEPTHTMELSETGKKHTVWTQSAHTDDGIYEIRLENGKTVEVKVNGKKVNQEWYTNQGDIILIHEPNGNELYEFHVKDPRPAAAPMIATTVRLVEPKVMLGINLDAAPETLREHLGLEHEAIIVERVIDGLSAHSAGIKTGDIIVSIDGSDGVSSESLSEMLSEYKPGQTAVVKVVRAGQVKDMKIKLQAYNAGLLGRVPRPSSPPTVLGHRWSFDNGQSQIEIGPREGALYFWNDHGDSIQQEVIDILDSVLRDSGLDDDDLEEIMSSVDIAIAESLAQIEDGIAGTESRALREAEVIRHKAEEAMKQVERQMLEFRDGRLTLRNQAEDAERRLFELREQLAERSEGINEGLEGRLDEIETRFEEVEDRFEELDERLERVVDLFERMADRILERLEDDE